MKKSHDRPARGSAKEAKAIQEKKKSKSFFDYSDEEKREIIEKSVEEGNKMQRETIRQAEKIKKAVETIHKFMNLKTVHTIPKNIFDAIDFLYSQKRCTNCGLRLIQIGPHEYKCSCTSEDVVISMG